LAPNWSQRLSLLDGGLSKPNWRRKWKTKRKRGAGKEEQVSGRAEKAEKGEKGLLL